MLRVLAHRDGRRAARARGEVPGRVREKGEAVAQAQGGDERPGGERHGDRQPSRDSSTHLYGVTIFVCSIYIPDLDFLIFFNLKS